uniref:rab GTPase-activating protein 1-like n=1 Tax=Gasterosteus aculeatus aculeatus TaxID=481459 RepID=UPI001A97F460|nr:rab GTPase-activating protein 1-like [Gasterosteus aculeatus aculeatus]
MMEEVSAIMAYDSHVMEQMSEDEILACLIPAIEDKLGESRLQLMNDDDSLDKYMKENHRLQQAGLRLEQENDNLAHRLISSKVALRSALDKAEDRVDELTKELFQTRHLLQATEEEKIGKEEEAAVSKEVFRRELEKAEHEVSRSSGIIADYKQICSQLTKQVEKQQAAHREELDALKSAVKACSRCRRAVESEELSAAVRKSPSEAAAVEGRGTAEPSRGEDDDASKDAGQRRDDQEKESLRAQIREHEQELAKTKLQMVEAKCKIQELEHQKGTLANDLQGAKNNWISKAFTSLRPSSEGGLHSIRKPRDGAPTVGWKIHRRSFSGWSTKKLSWPHKDNQENV